MQELYSNTSFWLIFFCFNTVIFLPVYLIHYPYSSFFPLKIPVKEKGRGRFDFIFCKVNQDIFRISADLAIMVLIAILVKDTVVLKPFSILCGAYFLLIVIYQITNALFRKIYHKEFTNFEVIQYLSLGYKIVRHSALQQIIILAMLLLLLLFSSCYSFHCYFVWIRNNQLSPANPAILTLLAVIPFYVKKNVLTLTISNKVFPLHIFDLYRILLKSGYKDYAHTSKIDFEKIMASSPKTDYSFTQQPNIFVIAVESYGRIVLDEAGKHGNKYPQYIAEAENLLQQKGYRMASALATSPISGAGSWIAYTSFLYGINLQNQMIYEHVFSSGKLHEYNHIFRWLHKTGYTNYRVNAVGTSFGGFEVPWENYKKFYAVDEWLHLDDMNYHGQKYGFGPSPADQFLLHRSMEKIREQNKTPFSFFLLTQNSHNPFYSLPDFYTNWKETNTAPEKPATKGANLVSVPRLSNYFKSIEYELKTISHFIATEGNENDIFIVFGDHQPPVFNEAKKGNETPVHIITKNSAFMEDFTALGFKDGLMPSLNGTIFNFAGIYSIFQRAFVRCFTNETVLPEYEPDGKPLFDVEAK